MTQNPNKTRVFDHIFLMLSDIVYFKLVFFDNVTNTKLRHAGWQVDILSTLNFLNLLYRSFVVVILLILLVVVLLLVLMLFLIVLPVALLDYPFIIFFTLLFFFCFFFVIFVFFCISMCDNSSSFSCSYYLLHALLLFLGPLCHPLVVFLPKSTT